MDSHCPMAVPLLLLYWKWFSVCLKGKERLEARVTKRKAYPATALDGRFLSITK